MVSEEKLKRKAATGNRNNNGDDFRRKKKKKKTTKVPSSSNANEKKEGSAGERLRFFVDEFQAANGLQLSSIELESLKDSTMLELPSSSSSSSPHLDVKMLGKSIKEAAAFGEEALCGDQLIQGKIPAGSPAVVIVSTSALRSIHLLKGFRSITKQCPAVKLFSKHIKLQEQISLLKNRVNIASGTPSRIKKLIDIEALGLSRLQVLVLDMHPDVKGYSLFTLPQVRDEFWDLFKNYFYQPMIRGNLRICLYGPYELAGRLKVKKEGLPVPDDK